MLSYGDSEFSRDLVYLMVGKKYVMRPNMGDDMSSLCFSYLDKDDQSDGLTDFMRVSEKRASSRLRAWSVG